ncbi:TolC family protein [Novipirellula artificiosorum]|uniref:Outer membrane efflux protein n=1 Tax=Novipirellula artificiosorum TaxID=2528016 RepID=A0A5C6DRB3_9BACT|nr:TolC family protein [Novipirellula artificiosorum]TWU38407.1 Outer membrane efflux protein [Novipirellula artificiosorum]
MNISQFGRYGLLFAIILSHSFQVNLAEETWTVWRKEQQRLQVRDPSQMRQVAAPLTPRPPTLSDLQADLPTRQLPLNEAINIALANSEVVRFLTGVTASTSGRTIYDVAITNARIDQERAAFDPQLQANNSWNRTEDPIAVFDPLDPTQAIIGGGRNDRYGFDFGLSQKNLLGGTSALALRSNSNRFQPGTFPLNPSDRTATEFSYTQPLLSGAGIAANQVPIVLARIDTERSFFQYKDSVQQLVQGVIEAYWSLVFAKTDLWAREQQVQQVTFAFERAQARVDADDANIGDLAQTEVALENFRASLLVSQANVLQRQAALMNILGLPPFEAVRMIPTTPMMDEPVEIDWNAINEMGQRQRPDIIELKLVLDADRQRLLLAKNQARPKLEGVALYRWNGLEGEVPAGNRIRSGDGQFNDWALGVNFSVPLGLRRDRALLRAQQLILRRDQENLEQGLHQMQHLLAVSLRNLDQYYAQYERFQAVRRAARVNLDAQRERYRTGSLNFIVVLQAIVDWGNAVSSEAQSLAQYNTGLAVLELQTGAILESHGIVFFEERFASIGPLGRLGPDHCYPYARRPSDSISQYPSSDQPSEEYFNLVDPIKRDGDAESESERTEGPRKHDLEEKVEFEQIDGQQGPMTDEEIDALLPEIQSSRSFSDWLKQAFRR